MTALKDLNPGISVKSKELCHGANTGTSLSSENVNYAKNQMSALFQAP